MKTNRGAFLATAAIGAALIADAQPARAAKKILGDYPTMISVLSRPARHRVVMGAPFIHNGSCLKTAHMLTAYQFANGENPPSVNLAISLYGPASIMMLMNDAWWAESKAFELCTALHDLPPEAVKDGRNPFYHAHTSMNPNDDPEDPNGFYLDLTVEALTKRGAHWFICANALHTAARLLKQLNNGEGEPDMYIKQMIAHLLPKASVVPSGEQALIVAQQEYHFAYIAAT
jgi:intracellular sulfur oxidation DsrE/DsrF family protein